MIGSFIVLSWDFTFIIMHKLLFRNDLWIFDSYSDPIILILPDTFFMHCGILIMILVTGFALCFRQLAYRLERHEAVGKKKEK